MSSTLSNGSSLIPLLLHFPVARISNLLPAKNLASELLLPQRYGFLYSPPLELFYRLDLLVEKEK
jgi:hypothetical protein